MLSGNLKPGTPAGGPQRGDKGDVSDIALRPKATIPLLALIVTALLLVLLHGTILLERIGTIRGADVDNRTWLMAQLEVDHKELRIALLQAQLASTPSIGDDAAVRRAFDIYYSRLATVTAALAPTDGTPFQHDSLARISRSRDAMADMIDGKTLLGRQAIRRLQTIADRDIRDIRVVTSESLLIFTKLAEEQRQAQVDLLIRLGLLMGLLVVLMTVAVSLAIRISREATIRARSAARTVSNLLRIFEASLDGVLVSDAAGNILYLNNSARRIFGHDQVSRLDELTVDMNLPQTAVDPETGTMHHLANVIDLGQIVGSGRHRLTGSHASGREFPLEVSIVTDQDIDGRLVNVFFLRDITEDVLAETRLRDARDQARRDAAAKSRFLAVMSHEMRTPLHGVLAALDLIDTAKLSGADISFLATARACGLSALDQVDEVLEITRSGATEVTITPFDPRRLLAELLAGLEPLASERGNRLALAPPRGEPCRPLLGWRRGFVLVMRNLVSNAVKFTRDGEILITADCSPRPDGRVDLDVEVRDTGVGIDPADHDRIFKEFEILDTGDRDGAAGVGLGLAIARTAVERMGGKLQLESARGIGTRFSFRLVLDPAPVAIEARVDAGAQQESNSCSSTAPVKRHVLVVDDNPVNLALMAEMLRRIGHLPATASDGPSAVALAQGFAFDLILMDIGMPGMDGMETTRAIREGGLSAFTPVIGVTALTTEQDRPGILDSGMQDVLSKPLGLAQLRGYLDEFFADHLPTDDGSSGFAEARILMGDAMMARLVEEVLKDADTALAELKMLKEDSDLKALQAVLHRAAGSAAVIGAPELCNTLLAGERLIRAGDRAALRQCEANISAARQATINSMYRSWPELALGTGAARTG